MNEVIILTVSFPILASLCFLHHYLINGMLTQVLEMLKASNHCLWNVAEAQWFNQTWFGVAELLLNCQPGEQHSLKDGDYLELHQEIPLISLPIILVLHYQGVQYVRLIGVVLASVLACFFTGSCCQFPLNTWLPWSLKILESPGIGKRKFQALKSPWICVAVLENPGIGKPFLPLTVKNYQN